MEQVEETLQERLGTCCDCVTWQGAELFTRVESWQGYQCAPELCILLKTAFGCTKVNTYWFVLLFGFLFTSGPRFEGGSEVLQIYQMQISKLLIFNSCFQRESWPLNGNKGKFLPRMFRVLLKGFLVDGMKDKFVLRLYFNIMYW